MVQYFIRRFCIIDKIKQREYNRKYYINNREKRIISSTKYNINNKDKIKLYRDSKRYNHELYLYKLAYKRAKATNIEFDIDIEDIIIPKICPYLNIEITNIPNTTRNYIKSNASIDRIDNTKGYIKGNIQIISTYANFLKKDATVKELQSFADGINRLHPRTISCLSTPE